MASRASHSGSVVGTGLGTVLGGRVSMALMPEAIVDLLPENATQAALGPTQVILHSAVDAPGPTNLARWFGRESVKVESHFWVAFQRKPGQNIITQMMDTNVKADANYRANATAISIETEDDGDPDNTPWTPAQIQAIAYILVWAHTTHAIPLELCTSPTSPGIGWHSMWGAPSDWTPVRGKTCPGWARINQVVSVVNTARQLAGMGPIKPREQPMPTPTPTPRTWKGVQQVLNSHGANPQLVTDGDPGPKTATAVIGVITYQTDVINNLGRQLEDANRTARDAQQAAAQWQRWGNEQLKQLELVQQALKGQEPDEDSLAAKDLRAALHRLMG